MRAGAIISGRSALFALSWSSTAMAIIICSACGGAAAEKDGEIVTVYAAASTADLITEIAESYQQESSIRLRLNFAASSTLARQIQSGAQADVFISANPQWMDYLQQEGLAVADTRRDLLTNRLVLVVPQDEELDVKLEQGFDVTSALKGRIAMGDPDHVPAGVYAKQALEHLGWWELLQDRVIPAVDVRAAMRLVEMREAQAGIVYASDAASSASVAVVATFPSQCHDQIRYPVALCGEATDRANGFLDYLAEPRVREKIYKFGFEPARE